MKKYLIMVLALLLSVFMLTACSDKGLISEKSLENYTLTVTTTIDSNFKHEIFKTGKRYSIKKASDEAPNYYATYGSKVLKYVEKDVDFGDTTLKSATATIDSTIDPANFEKLLINLKKSDVNKDELINLKNNNIISYLIDGISLDDETVRLDNAYKYGLIECTSAKLEIKSSKLNKIDVTFKYGGNDLVVTATFSDYGTTKIDNFPVETSYDKTYYSYFDVNEEGQKPKSVYIDVKFGDYGTVRFESLALKNDAEVNALNYFLYLFKKGAYSKANIDSCTTSIIMIGDQKEDVSKQIASKVNQTTTPSNKRGTLALKFTDDQSNPTQQFQINLTDLSSSYDTTSTVIAGVIDGFSVLDEVSQLSTNVYNEIKIKISVTYNDYTYTEPKFKN